MNNLVALDQMLNKE